MARIAIVGAGPAGAAAGWHLASRGHDVTLIDRSAFPRPKTCGDWITISAVGELAYMNLSRSEIERRAAEYAAIDTTVIVSPGGRRTASAGRARAYCIPRVIFDDMLWRHAVAAGCRPLRRAIRDIRRDTELISGFDHLVDARGTHAGTANAVALRAYWTVPCDRLETDEAGTVQIHTDATFRRGYGWLFPVSSDGVHVRFNVGVGVWRADSVRGRSVADFYERFVSTNTVLRRWRDAAAAERPVGCHVGLGLWSNRVADDEVLRIGDAANLADPLTGDGIGNALASGRHVAEVIASSRSQSDAGRAWQIRYDAVFGPELRRALVLRQVLMSTMGKDIAARVLDAAPFLRRRVHAAFFGETQYRNLLEPWP